MADANERLINNKHRVFINLLNAILKNINKDNYEEIKKIDEFVNIDRLYFCPKNKEKKDELNAIFSEMEKEILAFYTKEQLKHYQRESIKNYLSTCITYMAKDLGYEFKKTKRRDLTEIVDGDKKIKIHRYYSIVKN